MARVNRHQQLGRIMKKTLTTLAVTLLTASLALPATGAFADDFTSKTSGTKTGDTTATVGIDGGALTLDSATDLNFGIDNAITLGDQRYPAQGGATAVVTDLTGTGTGWDLTVKQDSDFTDGKATLAGAEIALPAGTVTGKDSKDTAATGAGTLSKEGGAVKLVTGAVKAADKYTATIGQEGTILTIPAGAITAAGTYTTTLTWTVAPNTGSAE